MTSSVSMEMKLPPKDFGMPILGHLLPMYRDMLEVPTRLQRKYQSNAIHINMAGQEYVMLLGPDANQMVLHNQDDSFSSAGGWEYIIGKVFPGAIMAMDGGHHRYQRRIMQQAFKKPVLVKYVESMNEIAEQRIGQWSRQNAEETFLVYDNIKNLLMDFGVHIFLGVELGKDSEKMVQHFVSCVQASLAIIRAPVPPFAMWRGVRGRRQLVKMFETMLPEKRASNTPDFFSQFCHAESEEGERYNDQEIIDHMIFLMLAAHDTTATALTAMFYCLAKHPEWQDKLKAELATFGDKPLDYEDMEKLTTLSWVFKECMRLYPSVPSLPRAVVKDINFEGYTIRAGQKVSIYPIHTHRDPAIWTNPEAFDPLRFSPERSEHTRHRFAYVPFGGGSHMCIGQHFAELQTKSIMSQVLRQFRWSVPDGYEMPYQMAPIGKPKDGLPVKLVRERG